MTDAAYPFADFPAYRFARVGLTPTQVTALAAQWAAMTSDQRNAQGLLIEQSPDSVVTAIASSFPAPLPASVTAVTGINPPSSPRTDDLWYNVSLDSWERWNGTAWVVTGGGGGGGVDATARATAATALSTASSAVTAATAASTAASTAQTTAATAQSTASTAVTAAAAANTAASTAVSTASTAVTAAAAAASAAAAAPSSSTTAVTKAGLILPPGWNTAYKAQKAAAQLGTGTLCEHSIHGDSTTYGQVGGNAAGSAGEYSWVNKLRALSQAHGYVDGGQGLLGLKDNLAMSGSDAITTVMALGSGAAAGGTMNFHGQYGVAINTLGATFTVQTKSTKLRVIRYRTSNVGGGGSYTYNVDGGAEQAATTCQDTSGTNGDYQVQNIILGGTAGTTLHTIVFTNSLAGGVELSVEAINTAGGMVFHKQGISGVLLGNEFPSQDTTGTPGAKIPPRFGLGLGNGAGTALVNQYGVTITKTANIRTGLHVLHLGINDLLQATSIADARTRADTVASSVAMFCSYVQADVGSSGVVCIPHLFFAGSLARQYEGMFRSAIINAASLYNVAIVDLATPLGGFQNLSTYGSSVHMNQAGYDAQATWFDTNVLQAA